MQYVSVKHPKKKILFKRNINFDNFHPIFSTGSKTARGGTAIYVRNTRAPTGIFKKNMGFMGFWDVKIWVFYGYFWDFISKYGCFMGIFNAGNTNEGGSSPSLYPLKLYIHQSSLYCLY